MENEENVKELELEESETEAIEDDAEQSEANDTKTEMGTELEQQIPENPQDTFLESQPLFTSELIENDNFTLQIDHQMTVGDMLVATLLAINIVVLLLCRLLRDSK